MLCDNTTLLTDTLVFHLPTGTDDSYGSSTAAGTGTSGYGRGNDDDTGFGGNTSGRTAQGDDSYGGSGGGRQQTYGDDDNDQSSNKNDSTTGKLLEKAGGFFKSDKLQERGAEKRRDAGSDDY